EVIESIHVLNGNGPQDTINLVAMQGGALLWLLGRCENEEHGRRLIIESLNDGRAAEKFQQMCVAQGTSQSVADELMESPGDVLGKAHHITEIQSQGDGWVESIDSMVLAEIAREHGAGRFAIEDEIDPAVGFILNAVKGNPIRSGQKWIEFHHNQPMSDAQRNSLSNALTVASTQTQPIERLIKVIQ
ncbi:MAG: hypothetical protein P8R03_02805, partial [Candidatus Poseidoniaceae archaeon]|nr:hypothetical protein [Candidatus Poseidoniaceae archaeon]